MQIQHKKLDVNRTRVSLVSIVQMLQAVDWGPPASHVAQSDHAESVTSDRSNVSASLESSRADANGSRATSESHALMNGSRTSSATGGVAGNAPTGAGDGEITLEKLTAGLGAATWGMGHQRQLLVHVAPEAEYVHADGDRLLQVSYPFGKLTPFISSWVFFLLTTTFPSSPFTSCDVNICRQSVRTEVFILSLLV